MSEREVRAIERVRELHRAIHLDRYDIDVCRECNSTYPCPTILACRCDCQIHQNTSLAPFPGVT